MVAMEVVGYTAHVYSSDVCGVCVSYHPLTLTLTRSSLSDCTALTGKVVANSNICTE